MHLPEHVRPKDDTYPKTKPS